MTSAEKKHVKFFERCLAALPSEFCEFDSSLISLVFFCVAGLCVLDTSKPRSLRPQVKQWLAKLIVDTRGFRGSASHTLHTPSPYDAAHLASTYFGLMLLCLVQIPLSETALDRDAIVRYLGQCQRPDGSIAPCYHESTGPYGDQDLRYVYFACAILRMLDAVPLASEKVAGPPNLDKGPALKNAGPDLDKLQSYVQRLASYHGGLGSLPGAESHTGLTFCGIAALSLIGRLDPSQWQSTVDFCVRRQNCERVKDTEYWGFNGRVNKPSDTCYSFWAGATLCLLGHQALINEVANKHFLLNNTQSLLMGGFCKNSSESRPDPLHSYLGLISMRLVNEVDPALAIPVSAARLWSTGARCAQSS